jgi:hypothetical protein
MEFNGIIPRIFVKYLHFASIFFQHSKKDPYCSSLTGSIGADKFRRLRVRTNADTPHDAGAAVNFGAEGIGLCRTEHMFFEESRIFSVRKMIISDTTEQREKALTEILPMQKNDFKGIFKAMGVRPVTIRLLDPPLHEFLPVEEEDIQELAEAMDVPLNELKAKINSLQEFNPMLGHRGCRLAISYPEIAKMQTRAIIEAAIEVSREENIDLVPEIMVPLVGKKEELVILRKLIIETAEETKKEFNSDLNYLVGTMIEIPRACLTADEVAEHADFFSFGTNDLTQMTFGYSRDDAGKFLEDYKEAVDKLISNLSKFEVIGATTLSEENILDLSLIAKELKISEDEVSQQISGGLAEITVKTLEKSNSLLGGLYISGGDVTVAVCNALGAAAIEVKDEVLPLAVYGRIIGGTYNNIPVITKGGLVGDEKAIIKCINYMFTKLSNDYNAKKGRV